MQSTLQSILKRKIWRPNNHGYMHFCFVCGPCLAQRWDIFNYRGYCMQSTLQSILKRKIWRPNNLGYMHFCFVCGPCLAQRWDIFKYRGCCVQGIFSKNRFGGQIIEDICSHAHVCGPCQAWR